MENLRKFYETNILSYIEGLSQSPTGLIIMVLDIVIVVFLVVKFLQIAKETRAWQLLKGIFFLIIATVLSYLLGFKILNYILTSFMTYRGINSNCYIPTRIKKSTRTIGYQ